MKPLLKPKVFTKQQAAYDSLRREIMEGDLKPGDRLVIDQLAIQLGMSSIPVREALSQLEAEGLVEIRPHAGAVVTDLPIQAIEEIFALLEAFEIVACRLGRGRLTQNDIAEMESLMDAMDHAADEGEWLRLNRRFHEALPRLAGLKRLEEQLIRVGEDWERLRRLRFGDFPGENLESANLEHREFLKALRAGNQKQMSALIQKHNQGALNRYLSAIALSGG